MSKAGRKFLVSKTNEILNGQVETYRSKQTKAGTLLGFSAIFLTFLITDLAELNEWQSYFSVVLLISIGISIIYFLMVIRSSALFKGMSLEELEGKLNESEEDIDLFEASTNLESIRGNEEVLETIEKYYKTGIIMLVASIVIAIVIILLGVFSAQHVKRGLHNDTIQNIIIMSKDKKPAKDSLPKVTRDQLRIIKEGDTSKTEKKIIRGNTRKDE
jgi:hypothetical protein